MRKHKKEKTIDFLPSNLPWTRKKQFFDIIKNRYRLLFEIGMTLLLFALPFLLLNAAKYIVLYEFSQNYEADQYRQLYCQTELIYLALLSLGVLSFFFGLYGVRQILKRLVWNEPIFYWYDFGIGIKKNLKGIFLSTLIFWLSRFGYQTMLTYNIGGNYVCYIPKILCLVILYPMMVLSIMQSTYYDSNLLQMIKTTIQLYIRRGLPIIGLFLAVYAMSLFDHLPYFTIEALLFVASLIFYLPIALLAIFECHLSVFDKFINEDYYPQVYKKGLYIPTAEDNQ